MLEDQDIEKLVTRFSGVLATKADMQQNFDKVNERLDRLESIADGLVTAVDGLVARVEMLNQEYLVLKERDNRYERWFHEIAEKVGVTLTP